MPILIQNITCNCDHEGKIRCPACISLRLNSPNKIWKNKKALSMHLRKAHGFDDEHHTRIMDAVKEFTTGDFTLHCLERGLIQ
jgi:uncharacterized C2H2 Zn-finger protein